jgi:hypothetical protein
MENIVIDQVVLSLVEYPTDCAIKIKAYWNCGRNSEEKISLIESDEWRILSIVWDEQRALPGTYMSIHKSDDMSNFTLCKLCWSLIH